MTRSEAIRQFASHIRKFSHVLGSDTIDINAPTDEQIAAHKAHVESLCDKLDSLAEGSPTFAEFAAIREQLCAINAVAPLGHYLAVQDTFVAAK